MYAVNSIEKKGFGSILVKFGSFFGNLQIFFAIFFLTVVQIDTGLMISSSQRRNLRLLVNAVLAKRFFFELKKEFFYTAFKFQLFFLLTSYRFRVGVNFSYIQKALFKNFGYFFWIPFVAQFLNIPHFSKEDHQNYNKFGFFLELDVECGARWQKKKFLSIDFCIFFDLRNKEQFHQIHFKLNSTVSYQSIHVWNDAVSCYFASYEIWAKSSNQ